MTQFYAYIYHDDTVPIYVGKGKGKRAWCHLTRSDKHPLTNKLAKMKREGREPRIQIIDAPDEVAAFEMEELLIAMIGRRDLVTGPLLNLTDGGEGSSGAIRSAETRAKQAASKLGLARNLETRVKISTAMTGRQSPKKGTLNPLRGQLNSLLCSKPCTVDGITIYPSVKELVNALGRNKEGRGSPNFRFVKEIK